MTDSLASRPLELPNGQVLKNRLAKAAMSENLGEADGGPRPGLGSLYRAWAEGGAGMLITGNIMIDGRACTDSRNVIVEDAAHLRALSSWAQAGRGEGTALVAQINHAGRQAARTRERPVAPSEVSLQGLSMLFKKPRALSDEEIEEVIDRFVTTAQVMEKAGFSGVQIHAAHGYLISQFLSPLSNRREDRWGGTPEKRMALLLEVVRRVRAAVAPSFILGVKLNSADFMRGGFEEADSMRVVEALNDTGIDFLEISGGNYEAPAMMGTARESTVRREAYFLTYAEKVRRLTKLPLMVTGGFRTRAGMEAALEAGIDLVGIARPMAVEPDLPAKVLSGETGATPLEVQVGIRLANSVLQASWYQDQMHRMADGLEPDPDLSRWGSVMRGFKDRLFGGGGPQKTLRTAEAPS